MAKLNIECCPICCAPVKTIETYNSVRFEYDAPRWISVEERLPEYDELVLCVGAKGGMFLGCKLRLFAGDKTAYCFVPNARQGRYATHWMPLPEPPKEE